MGKKQEKTKVPHVIVTGNPVDGFKFIGPFDDEEAATTYSEIHTFEWDWWIAPIQPKEQ